MTTIIISILAALGIGGGVMLASSGGGGSSGGSAVVGPVTPGDGGSSGGEQVGGGGGGSSGGSNTGGSTGGGSTGGGSTGGGTNATVQAGALLASVPFPSVTTIGKGATGNTTLNGTTLTIGMSPYAPIHVSGTTYRTNEEYDTTMARNLQGNVEEYQFVSGYTQNNPAVTQTINLSSIGRSLSKVNADFYRLGLGVQTMQIGTLQASYLKFSIDQTQPFNATLTNVTWSLNIEAFALGARQLGLKNSEFGYYAWKSAYSNATINANSTLKNFLTRYGAEPFYMFKTSDQLTNNYQTRYGNTATFTGNVTGIQHIMTYTNGANNFSKLFAGDISLSLNLANKTVSGTINNTRLFPFIRTGAIGDVYLADSYTGSVWYNLTLTGNINNVSQGTPNITFTNVTYIKEQDVTDPTDRQDLHPMNNSDNFGSAVIVKGNSPAEDELVGKIAFTVQSQNIHQFLNTYLAFGAKKQ